MGAATLLLVALSFGAGTPTYAGQGENNGKDEAARTATSSGSGGNADTAPGATKRQASPQKAAPKPAAQGGDFGDTTKPQPLSNADQNTGGANGQCPGGPYCSTRDGSPSLNGNGDGEATGKPCAGCVGRADNKNPKGQMPNGTDANKGYECDENKGVGQGNPAHTRCAVVPPVLPPPVLPPPEGPPPVVLPPPPPPPDILGVEREVARVAPRVLGAELAPAGIAPATAASPAAGTLPATGAGALAGLIASGGLGALLAGGMMLAVRRRRTTG